jgi:hypothetical protein
MIYSFNNIFINKINYEKTYNNGIRKKSNTRYA